MRLEGVLLVLGWAAVSAAALCAMSKPAEACDPAGCSDYTLKDPPVLVPPVIVNASDGNCDASKIISRVDGSAWGSGGGAAGAIEEGSGKPVSCGEDCPTCNKIFTFNPKGTGSATQTQTLSNINVAAVGKCIVTVTITFKYGPGNSGYIGECCPKKVAQVQNTNQGFAADWGGQSLFVNVAKKYPQFTDATLPDKYLVFNKRLDLRKIKYSALSGSVLPDIKARVEFSAIQRVLSDKVASLKTGKLPAPKPSDVLFGGDAFHCGLQPAFNSSVESLAKAGYGCDQIQPLIEAEFQIKAKAAGLILLK